MVDRLCKLPGTYNLSNFGVQIIRLVEFILSQNLSLTLNH